MTATPGLAGPSVKARATMLRAILSIIFCAGTLSACGGSAENTAEYGLVEAASDVRDHLSYGLESDPADPFRVELHVTEDLVASTAGKNIDQTWTAKMAEHQKGSVRLAVILMRTNPPADVEMEARRVIGRAQSNLRSIGAVTKRSARTDARSADAFAAAVRSTFQEVRLTQGKSPADSWVRKMAAYDRGGVKISAIAITRGTDSDVRSAARQVASSLAREADQLGRKADSAS